VNTSLRPLSMQSRKAIHIHTVPLTLHCRVLAAYHNQVNTSVHARRMRIRQMGMQAKVQCGRGECGGANWRGIGSGAGERGMSRGMSRGKGRWGANKDGGERIGREGESREREIAVDASSEEEGERKCIVTPRYALPGRRNHPVCRARKCGRKARPSGHENQCRAYADCVATWRVGCRGRRSRRIRFVVDGFAPHGPGRSRVESWEERGKEK
jgi:hypothetical protein